MSAIASYRTAILALLLDASKVYFTDLDCDEALRWALLEYSQKRPVMRTYIFTVLDDSGIVTLPADFVTRHITRVQLWDADPEDMFDLTFYAYQVDEQWVIDLHNGRRDDNVLGDDYTYARKVGDILQITYSAVHFVDGLDAAAGTTIPDADESLLEIGAAGHAAQMRALGRVEAINMNVNVVRDYRLLATDYLARFAVGLYAVPGIQVSATLAPWDAPGGLVF